MNLCAFFTHKNIFLMQFAYWKRGIFPILKQIVSAFHWNLKPQKASQHLSTPLKTSLEEGINTFFAHMPLLNWDSGLISLANSRQINIDGESWPFRHSSQRGATLSLSEIAIAIFAIASGNPAMEFWIAPVLVLPKLPKHLAAIKQNLKNARVGYCHYCHCAVFWSYCWTQYPCA